MSVSRDISVRGCTIGTDCSAKGIVRKGMCVKHYQRWYRTGSALTEPVKLSISERFWVKVDKTPECWNWTGQMHYLGYGRFSLSAGVHVLAHRFAYEEIVGSIPSGLELDHLCRNRGCCNPKHLEPVTHKENVRRAVRSAK